MRGHRANKKGLQNRLNALALSGAAKIEQSEQKLIELGERQNLNQDEIKERLADAPQVCIISLSTAIDAVLDQDMICLTGFMERPEAAIASSDMIRINDVYSISNTILWSVFCDELISKLDHLEYGEKAVQVHGGFQLKPRGNNGSTDLSSGVMKNAFRHMLNFAYPLYINADHWEVVKHYIPQVVAWMATLDFAAQSFEQLKNVPFVLVGHAIMKLMENPNDAHIQTFLNVARVARQIVKDYNMKHINEDFANWQKGFAGRVPKSISNIFVFLTKLIFMTEQRNGSLNRDLNGSQINDSRDLNENLDSIQSISLDSFPLPKLDDAFWQSVLEEETRRIMSKQQNPILTDKFVADQSNYRKFVVVPQNSNIDVSRYARAIDPNAVIGNKSRYVAPVFQEENVVTENKEIDLLLDKFANKFANVHKMISTMRKFYELMRGIDRSAMYDSFDKNLGIIDRDIANLFDSIKQASVNDSVSSSSNSRGPSVNDSVNGIVSSSQNGRLPNVHLTYQTMCDDFHLTKEQLYGMIILNQHHANNLDREGSKIEEIAQRNVKQLVKEEVEKAIQAEQSRLSSSLQNDAHTKLAALFAKTDNLNVAAGIIKLECPNIGAPLFRKLLSAMQSLVEIPHRMKKIKMLVEGKFEDIDIYRSGFCYPAKKKNRNRIIFAYNWNRRVGGRSELSKEDPFWNTIFKYKSDRKFC